MSTIAINDLPDEILLHIFSYLNIRDLALGTSQVSTRWRNVSQDFSLWRGSHYVVSHHQPDEEAANALSNMPHLQTLTLQRMLPSELLLQVFSTCQNLTELEIQWTHKLLPSELGCLVENCPNLEKLVVPGQRITAQHLELIALMEKLKSLRFEYRTLTYRPFKLRPLAFGCPNLSCLEIPLQFCSGDELDEFLALKAGQIEALELRWMTSDGRSQV